MVENCTRTDSNIICRVLCRQSSAHNNTMNKFLIFKISHKVNLGFGRFHLICGGAQSWSEEKLVNIVFFFFLIFFIFDLIFSKIWLKKRFSSHFYILAFQKLIFFLFYYRFLWRFLLILVSSKKCIFVFHQKNFFGEESLMEKEKFEVGGNRKLSNFVRKI